MRGVHYRGGYHDFIIRRGGLQVFPRLVAHEHHRPFSRDAARSGVAGLDALLGEGLIAARARSSLVLPDPVSRRSPWLLPIPP
jgi:hypothetical protein